MDESRIDIPQTPQVTGKAEDEGEKGTQSISSIRQTPEVTEKTEDEGGNPDSSQPEITNDQVEIPLQMFPLRSFHRLPDGSENIESVLDPDRQCNFEVLVENMKKDAPKIRKWYVEVERRLSESNRELGRMMALYSEEELGRMMAQSGLLLLEFLRFLANLQRLRRLRRLRRSSNEFFESMERQLSEAVIKIDNRIPIFVLKKILQCEGDADTDLDSILKHAWPVLSPIKYDSHEIAGVPLKDDSHLLEFVYENIIGSSDFKHAYNWRTALSHKRRQDITLPQAEWLKVKWRKNKRRRDITLPQAEWLKGKGVKFARNEGLLKSIRFDLRNRTLYLPAIEMKGRTDAVLKNLVLFEQGKESQPLMSYVSLMDRLIDTAEDVRALAEGGIIHSHLPSNIEVAKVWNGMCELIDKEIKYEPIDKAIYGVKNFYTSKYRTMCIECYGTHFSKPWSAISFFAACILFALAAFQTYLAWEQVRLQRESTPKT